MNRRRNGFTLMETLVMLVLVSFAVLLMFQMLGSYRIARERALSHAGGTDRRALFDDWFRDTVHGLRPAGEAPFTGTGGGFAGMTLNPLFATSGAPVPFQWNIEEEADGWQVRYVESGEPRFALAMTGPSEPRFVYYDVAGESYDSWPPKLGVQQALPAGVALVRQGDDADRTLFSAVPGPLDAWYDPYQLEIE